MFPRLTGKLGYSMSVGKKRHLIFINVEYAIRNHLHVEHDFMFLTCDSLLGRLSTCMQ